MFKSNQKITTYMEQGIFKPQQQNVTFMAQGMFDNENDPIKTRGGNARNVDRYNN